jgi:hypothetical protein
MPRDLNKSLGQLAKHPFHMGIPQRSYANPDCNAAAEGACLTTEVKAEVVEAVSGQVTIVLTTSPKDLGLLQKTRACSGATIRSSIVLAADRTNNKQTGEAYCSRSQCLHARREACSSHANRQQSITESHQPEGGTRLGLGRI